MGATVRKKSIIQASVFIVFLCVLTLLAADVFAMGGRGHGSLTQIVKRHLPPGLEKRIRLDKPVLITPEGEIATRRPLYQWQPVEGANRYGLIVHRVTPPRIPVYIKFGIRKTQQRHPWWRRLKYNTDYFFVLIAYNKRTRKISPLSDKMYFRVVREVPNQEPVALFTAAPESGPAPLTVNFDASGSHDPDGTIASYQWDFDGDGTFDGQGKNTDYTYTVANTYTVKLRVTDNKGAFNEAFGQIAVTHPVPTVSISANPDAIALGETSTLSWSSTDADSCVIEPGIGSVDPTGSIAVAPTETTTYTITATGLGGSATAFATVTVYQPPTVSLSVDPVTILLGETATLTWSSTNADAATLDQGIGSVTVNGSTTVSPSESTTYTITVTGPGGTATAGVTLTVTDPSAPPTVSFNASPSIIEQGGTSILSWASTNAQSAYIDKGIGAVSVNGSISVSPEHTITYTITVTGSTGSAGAKAAVMVSGDPAPQPEGSFGTRYEDLAPADATVEAYDPERFSLITGLVQDLNVVPIADVSISIHGHPEYGTTTTDSDGRFSIPVEGGNTMTLVYQKQGLITAHRKVYVPWNDIAIAKTINMIFEDPASTTLTFDGNPETVVTHQSAEVTDDYGSRSCSMVFTGDNHAYLVDEDGNDVNELTTITTRATEFTTPDSMPAILPPNSAYTYCAELSVDGAQSVRFDKPVITWVDNFLGFDVGEIVPVGYYDRDRGVWVPSDNGVVVRLLDTDADGMVDALDADGDGLPDDLDSDGLFSDEVMGLDDGQRYPPDSTFWRVAVTHFTPWDMNWPRFFEEGSIPPNGEEATVETQKCESEECYNYNNSYISHRSRIFHEDIPIPGTDITLHYSSNRVPGYKTAITVPVSGDTVPSVLNKIVVKVEVAGRILEKELSPLPNQITEFIWDGLDHLGNQITGSAVALVKVGFVYDAVYASPANFAQAFAAVGDDMTAIRAREEVISWKRTNLKINLPIGFSTIAEGWTVSENHFLSPLDQSTLHKGDGSVVEYDNSVIDTIAGTGTGGYNGEGIPATQAQLWSPHGVETDAQGNIYIAEYRNHRIRKIDKDGVITTVAGNGIAGYGGDGGPAVSARLNHPLIAEVDKSGNIYIADRDNYRIRKVDANGIITTIAGTGTYGYSGDGGPATQARIVFPTGIALDDSGNLYIADYSNHRVRKVDVNGIITTVTGNGVRGNSGDGGPATDAMIDHPCGVAVDLSGNLYIVAEYSHSVRKVDTSGIITTIAGIGEEGYTGDGGPATEARFYLPTGIDIDSSGNVYIVDRRNNSIRKINKDGIISTVAGNGTLGYNGDGYFATKSLLRSPYDVAITPLGDLVIADVGNQRIRKIVPSSDFINTTASGSIPIIEDAGYYHVISDTGLHDSTSDLDTGIVLREFGYDEDNNLVSITDRFGNATNIVRGADGVPTAIVSPDGLPTTFIIDADNHLTGISYPDGSQYGFEYTADGLMTAKIEPEGNRFEHQFDSLGRLTDAMDEEEGHWIYEKTAYANGDILTEVTTGEGNLTAYLDHTDSTGAYTSTITDPTGAETLFARSADGIAVSKSLPCGMELEFKYDLDSEYKFKFVKEMTETTPSLLEKITLRSKTYEDTNSDSVPDLIAEEISVNGNVTTLEHNTLQATKTITSPEGRTVTAHYDPSTLLTESMSVPGLFDATYDYDLRGRLTSITTNTRQTAFTYNSEGFLESVTDPETHTTTYSYDPVGLMTGISRPDGSALGFIYDGNGNMTVLTNPSLVNHGFEFNNVNLNSSYQTPLSGSYSYIYDKDRRLIQTNFPSGKQIFNIYDTIRLMQIQTPEGNIDFTYLCGTKAESITKDAESITYGYDGSLVTSETLSGSLNQTLSYTYNNDFDVTGFTYAGGIESYSYDNDGLLTGAGGFSITRNAQNGLPEAVTGGSLSISRIFNGYGEVSDQGITVSGQQIGSWNLARDDNGRIVQKTETGGGISSTYVYIYDSMGRLLTVTKDGSLVEEYAYDANGARIYEMNAFRGIAGKNYSYSDEDHLLTAGTVTYSYDLDGFLTTKTDGADVTSYDYSTRGELLSVTLPDGTAIEYVHDPLGRRIAKKVNGTVMEKYLWQGLTRLLAVYDGTDNLLMRFEYADSRMPVAVLKGGTTYYLAYDQVGSLRIVADASGNVVRKIEYDSFGSIIDDVNPAFELPFGFAGGLHDSDTGLVRFGHRDYDPDIARWTAKDPIFFNGGDTDLYSYCLNDPINIIDPLGSSAACEAGCVLKGLGRIVGITHIISGVDALTGVLLSIVKMPTIANVSATGTVIGLSGVSQFWGAERLAHSISDPIVECLKKCRNEDDDPC